MGNGSRSVKGSPLPYDTGAGRAGPSVGRLAGKPINKGWRIRTASSQGEGIQMEDRLSQNAKSAKSKLGGPHTVEWVFDFG